MINKAMIVSEKKMETIELNLTERMAIANAINFYTRNDTSLQNSQINEEYSWELNSLKSALSKVEKNLNIDEKCK